MPPREYHTHKVEELTTINTRRLFRRFGFFWWPINSKKKNPIGLQICYKFNAIKNKSRRHNVNLWAIQNWLASIWSHRKLNWRMDGSLDQILKRSGEEKRTFRSGQCSEIANRDTSVMKVPPTLKCSSDCALLTCTWQDSAKRGTWSCRNCQEVHRVSWPNSITHLTQTPIYEWCVVRSGSKNCCKFNNQHNLKGIICSFKKKENLYCDNQ